MSALAYALSVLLALPVGGYAKHIRERGGDAHVSTLAWLTHDAAQLHRVDQWVLAALTYHASGYDGLRVGKRGELGLTQVSRGNPAGQYYRHHCRGRQNDACMLMSLDIGAAALQHGLKVCGDYWQAVGWVRSGRCVRSKAGRRVMATAHRLRLIGRQAS